MELNRLVHPYIEEFVDEYTKKRNWNENRKRSIALPIEDLVRYVNKEPQEITKADIIRFFKFKKEQEYWTSSTTITKNVHIIQLFYQFLFEKNMVKEPYRITIKIYKEFDAPIDRAIFNAIRKQKMVVDRTCTNMRDKAVWYLINLSTAYIADIPRIKKENVNLDNNYIILDEVAENRLNYVILSSQTVQILRLYLAKCRINSEYLFPAYFNTANPIKTDTIRNLLRTIAMRSKIHISSRQRLEMRICLAVKAGVDIPTLQGIYGIKNLSLYQKYFDMTKLRPFSGMRKINKVIKQYKLI